MAKRVYFVKPKSEDDGWWEAYGPDMLARTVIEEEEIFDTGILDENGNKVMAKRHKPPIGFYALRER